MESDNRRDLVVFTPWTDHRNTGRFQAGYCRYKYSAKALNIHYMLQTPLRVENLNIL